jgi:N-formylglutamate amidohydrolase
MNLNGVHLVSAKRFRGTWVNRHIGSSQSREDAARVGRRLFYRNVAMNGANAEKVQWGMIGG